MKKCSKCLVSLPLENFFKNAAARDGLQSQCKDCRRHYGQTPQYKANRKIYKRSPKYQAYLQRAETKVASRTYMESPRGRFRVARSVAKSRRMAWSIPEEEYVALIARPCFYCGRALNPTSVGLDRINNDGGYSLGNVVPCCARCNVARNRIFTFEQFRDFIAPAIRAMDAAVKNL